MVRYEKQKKTNKNSNAKCKCQKTIVESSLVAQWVKDLVLSWLWLKSRMWGRFKPSPGKNCSLEPWQKKKKKQQQL